MEREIYNSYRGNRNSKTGYADGSISEFVAGAREYSDVDLNQQLIKNKEQTFFFRMNGDSMSGAGILSGDVLIVDRSITNVNGKVVIAVLNGEMIVRRIEKTFNKVRLIPETAKLAVIEVDPFSEFSVWGVVTYVIHTL